MFQEGILKDFRAIRKSAEDAGLFRPSRTFFAFIMAHILMFEFLGWWTMHQFGISWIPYITACCFLTITQVFAYNAFICFDFKTFIIEIFELC